MKIATKRDRVKRLIERSNKENKSRYIWDVAKEYCNDPKVRLNCSIRGIRGNTEDLIAFEQHIENNLKLYQEILEVGDPNNEKYSITAKLMKTPQNPSYSASGNPDIFSVGEESE